MSKKAQAKVKAAATSALHGRHASVGARPVVFELMESRTMFSAGDIDIPLYHPPITHVRGVVAHLSTSAHRSGVGSQRGASEHHAIHPGRSPKPRADILSSIWDWAVKEVDAIKDDFAPIIDDVKAIVGDVTKLYNDLKKLFSDFSTFGKVLKMDADANPRSAAYAAKAAADGYNRGQPPYLIYDGAANAAIAQGGLGSWLAAEQNHHNPIAVTFTGPAGPVRSWGNVSRYSRPCVDGSGHAYVASRTTISGVSATRLIPMY